MPEVTYEGGELTGLTTVGLPDDPPVFLFGFTSPVIPGVVPWPMGSVSASPTPILEIVIPEPGVGMMCGLSLALGFGVRRKR